MYEIEQILSRLYKRVIQFYICLPEIAMCLCFVFTFGINQILTKWKLYIEKALKTVSVKTSIC